MPTNTLPPWTLRQALPEDVEPIAELRAVVMRPDLERLGRYDEHRVRQRLRDAYAPEHTSVVEAAGSFAGCVARRLYERHGFTPEREDAVDVFLVRNPTP
ncbi:hypothetical protein ACWGQ9_00195 [Streptomyces parvus]